MSQSSTYHKEEKLNTLSHALGIVLGIIGLVLMLKKADQTSKWVLESILAYSFSVILLFTASTLYHFTDNPSKKQKLRILDHISIYFLIAGTYTPVALITLKSSQGTSLFFIVWGVALVGSLFKIFYTGKFEWLSLMLYLVMGWLIIFDFQFLWSKLSTEGGLLFLLGGAFYTLGTIFYAIRKIPYNHFIWHLFVLGGAVSHWLLIYVDVL
ncbi:MAG: hemolysin III family protein [Muriicola sp.]|nr:hemolysin III family protein [Muriicola sp.]MBT8282444.1 hemolysin III family protein [Muriicola sp.]NNK11426.1 hemolysin III family protein [Flavobacteriaceae bacterium]